MVTKQANRLALVGFAKGMADRRVALGIARRPS